MNREVVGEAPGRLDVMGGVADYSGAMVLETPIQARVRAEVRSLDEPVLRFESEGQHFELPLDRCAAAWSEAEPTAAMAALLRELQCPAWVAYPVGCLTVLVEAKGCPVDGGLDFRFSSEVPQSMGVSSSAALEIATLRALATYFEVEFEGTELARLGQRAENRVAGAPCGLMDQLTAAHGRAGELLPILCRPDLLQEPIPLPPGIMVLGWPTGVKHAVSGDAYGRARTAAFMGKRIIEGRKGRTFECAADIHPGELERYAGDWLPATLTGREFLDQYEGVQDPLSVVQPGETYPVREALRFPVGEHQRVRLAVALLRQGAADGLEERLKLVGELMFLSHAGYHAIGLGCPEADERVEFALETEGVFGARISGGGAGGTVAVLLKEEAAPLIQARQETMAPGLPLIF